jgi:hypothetical protein
MQIEDILSLTCSSVKLAHSNDFQRVFLLADSTGAKLAFDVLVAYGFDVKVYHQDDNTSKLYVTHPTLSQAQLDDVLAIAKEYATTLKQIQLSLESLCDSDVLTKGSVEYNMTFANLQPNSKQVLIQISPTSQSNAPARSSAALAADTPAVASAPVAAHTASTAQNTGAKRGGVKAKGHYEEFSSGPAVGRGKYPGSIKSDGAVPEETMRRRALLFLFGNMATSSYAFLLMVVALGAIFALLVFAKGIMCPDFASLNNDSAWYCKREVSDEEAKAKKLQRRKQLGLPPTEGR